MIGQYVRLLLGLVGQHSERSAFRPLLWLCAMFLAAAYCFGEQEALRPSCFVLVVMGIGIAALVCSLVALCTVRCPERLQSEGYQILTRALRLVEKKSDTIKMQPDSISSILRATIARLGDYRAPEKTAPDRLDQ